MARPQRFTGLGLRFAFLFRHHIRIPSFTSDNEQNYADCAGRFSIYLIINILSAAMFILNHADTMPQHCPPVILTLKFEYRRMIVWV